MSPPNPKPSDMSKDMGTMETSISDLQDELDVANETSKNHFKPGWLLTAIVVALVIGLGTFLSVTKFVSVDRNTEAIRNACEIRNEEIAAVNLKFSQLVDLFDASFEDRPPNQPPPTEEVLKLYDQFRKPIRLLDCKDRDALFPKDLKRTNQ